MGNSKNGNGNKKKKGENRFTDNKGLSSLWYKGNKLEGQSEGELQAEINANLGKTKTNGQTNGQTNGKKTGLLARVEKHKTKLTKTKKFIDTMLENRPDMEYAAAGSGQSAESNTSISEAQSPLVYYDVAYEKKKKQMGL